MSDDKKLSDNKKISTRDRDILREFEKRKERNLKPNLGRQELFSEVEYDKENFHYHAFNDIGNRIKVALSMGYEPVLDKDGAIVREVVNKYAGTEALMMKIPMDLWELRQKTKHKEARKMEDDIHKGNESEHVKFEKIIDK